MVEKQLEPFPRLITRFYGYYDTSTVGLYICEWCAAVASKASTQISEQFDTEWFNLTDSLLYLSVK